MIIVITYLFNDFIRFHKFFPFAFIFVVYKLHNKQVYAAQYQINTHDAKAARNSKFNARASELQRARERNAIMVTTLPD